MPCRLLTFVCRVGVSACRRVGVSGGLLRYLFLLLYAFATVSLVLSKAMAQEAFRVPTDAMQGSDVSTASTSSTTSTSPGRLTDLPWGSRIVLAYAEGSPEATVVTQPQSNWPGNPNLHVYGEGEGAELGAQPRRFVYGLSLTIRGVYDDNINISHDHRSSDFYFAIEPSITLGLGDASVEGANNLRFVYSPSFVLFVDHSEADAVQHLIHLDGQHYFGHLTLSLGEDIAILDGTDIRSFTDSTSSTGGRVNLDVGGRTRENVYNSRLNASYDLTGKTFLTVGINSSITDYPNSSLFGSNSLSGNLSANYRYSEKLTVGLGGTGGHNFVDDPNPDETFEQANVRVSYVLTGKINLNASAGVEFRQFEDESRGQYVSPIFELSATYQMSDSTSFSLTGSRRTYTSGVLIGQDFAGTTITAGVRQRFFQRIYVGLFGGYENNEYFETISGIPANRNDDYFFIEPTIDFNVTRFWTVGAYYLHRQNDSSATLFSFYDNQAGIRMSLTF